MFVVIKPGPDSDRPPENIINTKVVLLSVSSPQGEDLMELVVEATITSGFSATSSFAEGPQSASG